MSGIWGLVAFVVAVAAALVLGRRAVRHASPNDMRANHVGRPVPVVLGRPLVRGGNTGLVPALGLALLAGPVPSWRVPALLLAGSWILFLVGRLDDRAGHQARGLRAHLESGLRGRPTTGIWKMIAGIGLAAALSVAIGGGAVRIVASTVVIALAINVTNALDVRPGRAAKWAALILLPAAVWLRLQGQGPGLAVEAYLGGLAGVVRLDLDERGMLGDAGSNPLGLVVGVALAVVLPVWGLVVALLALLGLQIAAETVTISRLIDAVPPLRWLDRLGRRN